MSVASWFACRLTAYPATDLRLSRFATKRLVRMPIPAFGNFEDYAMMGYIRIKKSEFYRNGGFANTRQVRKMIGHTWSYWFRA